MLVTIIVFILVFGVVVVAHEFGHFLLAKLNGIRVVEFAVGMGPVILQKKKGETNYVLRLLPIGGACMFEGEDGVNTKKEEDAGKKEKSVYDTDVVQTKTTEGSFQDANVWARIATVVAGPLFNIILAFLLSLIVVGFTGSAKPVVNSVIADYPAEAAGFQVGDIITKIDGERVYLQGEVTLCSALNRGEAVTIEYEREGERYTTILQPKYDEEAGRYYMGFSIGEYVTCKGLDLIKYSAYETRYVVKATVKSLVMLVQGKLSKDDLSGPVGIAVTIDETIEETKPYGLPVVVLTMINFAVLLSANLGVMNLLPIPALDGGRLLFLLFEVVRGKPIPPEKEGIVHFVGFVALMILMVFVMYNDIARIFS